MRRVILALSILLVFALSTSAQVLKPFNVYVGGGVSLPMSPEVFKDNWKIGFHGTVGVGYKAAPTVQIVGKAEYHSIPFDWGDISGVSGFSLNALMFGVDGRFVFGAPDAPAKPLLFAGLGVANVSFSDLEGPGVSVPITVEETKVYFNAGGGVEFKAGPTITIFIQASYVSIATSGEATGFVPITAGIKF